MNQQKLINDLNRVFNPNDKSVKQLLQLVSAAKGKQVADLSYYVNNGIQWNADAKPEDIARVLNDLKQLQIEVQKAEQNGAEGLSAACGLILNDLPYKTNADVAKLQSRVNNAKLGLDVYNALTDKQSDVVDKIANVVSHDVKPAPIDHSAEMDKLMHTNFDRYHPQATRKALAKIAYRNATDKSPVELIYHHVNEMSMDLDHVIDFALKNNVNPNVLKDKVRKIIAKNQQKDVLDGKWERAVSQSFSKEAKNFQRIFVTELKARQVQASAAAFKSMGYKRFRTYTRHSNNVCRYCMGMDAKAAYIDDLQHGVNAPPFHPYCGCNIEPAI